MVKTPRTRHSKTVREPVTIDLQPGEVSRVKAEAEKAGADKPGQAASPSPASPAPESSAPESPAPKSAEAPKPAAAKEPAAAPEPPKAQDPKPAQKDPKPAETPKQASASGGPTLSGGPAFGRSEPPREPAKEPSGKPAEKPAAAAPAQRNSSGALLAGVAGGVIALLVAGGLSVAGLLPGGGGGQPEDPAPAIAALEAQIVEVRGQVAQLGAGGADEELAGRIAQSEERVAALGTELETLRGEVAGLGGDAPAVDLGPLEARIAAVETALAESAGGEAVSPEAALAALDERVAPLRQDIAALREEIGAARESHGAALARLDAVEEALSRLSGRVDEQAEAPATAAIIAVSALKAAIDRGTPFAIELQTWASLAPDAPQIEGLQALAAEGVATRAQLAAESDAAANAMIAAAQPVDPDAGVLDKLWGSAMGLVQVRPIGMVEGEGVPEIAARIDAAVAVEDYQRAMAEFETLPEAAKAAGAPFMARVRARHEADRLIDEALAAALKA